jgi:hypothetical protein
MQKKIKHRLPSTSKQESGKPSELISPLENGSTSLPSSPSIANDYYSILLGDFVRQTCNDSVNPETLEEFLNQVKDKKAAYIQRLVREINIMETNFNLVQLIVKRLSIKLDETAVQNNGLLSREELWKTLTGIIPVRKTDSLQLVVSRSKRILMDLRAKQEELKRIMPIGEGSKIDRKWFSRLIIEVEKFFKIQIDRERKYLCDFVELVIDMKEGYANMKRELKK